MARASAVSLPQINAVSGGGFGFGGNNLINQAV